MTRVGLLGPFRETPVDQSLRLGWTLEIREKDTSKTPNPTPVQTP